MNFIPEQPIPEVQLPPGQQASPDCQNSPALASQSGEKRVSVSHTTNNVSYRGQFVSEGSVSSSSRLSTAPSIIPAFK